MEHVKTLADKMSDEYDDLRAHRRACLEMGERHHRETREQWERVERERWDHEKPPEIQRRDFVRNMAALCVAFRDLDVISAMNQAEYLWEMLEGRGYGPTDQRKARPA